MKDLTTGNIYRNFITFAIPMVLAALFAQAYNTIDTVIAGQYLGADGIAAVGATSAFITLVSSLFWGLGTGLAVYIAKLFGAGAYEKLRSDIFSCVLLMIGIQILLCTLILIFRTTVYDFLNVDPLILEDVDRYFIIYLCGFFLITLNATNVALMNALGSSGFPFIMSVLSAVLNIGGNIFCVTVLKWDTAGIAASSVFAAGVVDLCYFCKLLQCFRILGIHKSPVHLSVQDCSTAWRYAIPTCTQQFVMYLASLAMSPIVNGIGSAATAGYTVALKMYDINASVYQNSAKTLSNYAAQNAGAKKYDNIHRGLRVGLVQGLVFVAPFLLSSVFFAPQICGMFFPEGYTGLGLDYAILFARYFLPFILCNLINNLFHAFYRGIAAMSTLLLSTCIGSATRIVSGIVFARYFGMTGVYIGWANAWLVEALFCLVIYLRNYRTLEMLKQKISG